MDTKAKGVVIERLLDAPREVVWRAWTVPEERMRWWGPTGYTSPACKIDLKVGGKYLFCMETPEGQKMYSTGVYREIVLNERLVYVDSFSDGDGNVVSAEAYGMPATIPLEMKITLTFEDVGGKTKLTIVHEGLPAGEMSDMTVIGWNESIDRLAAYLN
ncbi:MAG: SRPBCC domain-containing protein [Spirochaetia bacterium]|nr:SRPBCC domain-containing protein [Spirochaetia bacterium]